MLIQSLLIAPDTLFRTELGDDNGRMTPFELAQALSYAITDGPPDSALRAAAEQDRLQTEEDVRNHASRLLGSAATADGLIGFLDSMFHFRDAGELAKDPAVYPAWSEALAQDMADETETFIRHVLWDSSGTFSELMTAQYSFLNTRLAPVYGVDVDGTALQRTPLPEHRSGILSHGSFLATFAHDNASAPIARGHFIREVLLCQPVPPPPPEALNDFVERDPTTTARQWLLEQHASQPACRGCHALMDPLGLPFEQFDGVGAFRTEEVGQPIDPSGEITAFGSLTESIPVSGPKALAQALSNLDVAKACMVRRLFEHTHRRDAVETDKCALDALTDSFSETGSLRSLLAAMVSEPSFFVRRAAP